jgi:NhaA family Na+:H+ antiporter
MQPRLKMTYPPSPKAASIFDRFFRALIVFSINAGTDSVNGWGVPMATDIAFAISALVLLGKRVPIALVTFLVALAIVDDLGAVLVIAVFYTDQIYLLPLVMAGMSFLILVALNRNNPSQFIRFEQIFL